MSQERDNILFQLGSNQSWHRLPERTQVILANRITGDLRKVIKANSPDFGLAFRMQMDPQLRTANWQHKRGPFAVWNKIHQDVSFALSRKSEQFKEVSLELGTANA